VVCGIGPVRSLITRKVVGGAGQRVWAEVGWLGMGLGVGSWGPVLEESSRDQGYGLVEVSSGVGGCGMAGQ